MDWSLWWLFPVAILIAAIANGAGIGGATFFSPEVRRPKHQIAEEPGAMRRAHRVRD